MTYRVNFIKLQLFNIYLILSNKLKLAGIFYAFGFMSHSDIEQPKRTLHKGLCK